MLGTAAKRYGAVCLLLVACATEVCAQKAPYDVFPPAEAPYYRVRYEGSDNRLLGLEGHPRLRQSGR